MTDADDPDRYPDETTGASPEGDDTLAVDQPPHRPPLPEEGSSDGGLGDGEPARAILEESEERMAAGHDGAVERRRSEETVDET